MASPCPGLLPTSKAICEKLPYVKINAAYLPMVWCIYDSLICEEQSYCDKMAIRCRIRLFEDKKSCPDGVQFVPFSTLLITTFYYSSSAQRQPPPA